MTNKKSLLPLCVLILFIFFCVNIINFIASNNIYNLFIKLLEFIENHFTALTFIGGMFAFIPRYFKNESLKREDRKRQQEERLAESEKKRRELSMALYKKYLDNFFMIYKNRDFDPNHPDIQEASKLIHCDMPLFLPDEIFYKMKEVQENVKKFYYFQLNGHNQHVWEKAEQENCESVNVLISMMRKDIMPDSKVTSEDIKDLLTVTDYEFISKTREKILESQSENSKK